MEFKELIKQRFSTRNFSNKVIDNECLNNILKIINYVPTSKNKQTQRLRVISNEADLKLIDKCTACRYNANVVIIIGYYKNDSYLSNNIETGIIDASITTTYLMQSATDNGVDSVWVGNFNYCELVKLFQISDDIIPIALLMLGYKNEGHTPSSSHYSKKEYEALFF